MAPAVQQVHQTLESNLDYFMQGVGTLVEKYEALAAKVRDEIAAAAAAEAAQPVVPVEDDITVIRLLRSVESKIPEGSPKSATTKKDGETKVQLEGETAADKEKGGEEEVEEIEEEVDDNTSATSDYDPSPDGEAPKFPDNSKLLEQFQALKKEAYELNVTFSGIHDWIALSLPDLKMEDDESMEVADTMMSQVSGLDETLQSVYSLEQKYVDSRMDLECEILKYPDAPSLRVLLKTTDDSAWRDIEHSYVSMIRVCIILHTHLNRNMKTLRNPRAQRVNLSM